MTEKGPSLLCPGALVHLPGESGRIALLTPLDTPARSLEIESRGRALPFWGRGGDVCRSSERVSESIRHDFGFRGGEVTEKGPSLLCPGALVHLPGESGRIALLTPLDSPARSLENENGGGVLPFRGRGGDMSPSPGQVTSTLRRDFGFRGGGGDREGPVAHLSWGSGAPSWGEGGGRPFSPLSTHPLAPSKTKVAAERCRSGREVWMCPPDWNKRRNRSLTISIFEGSGGEGTDAHLLWGPRAPSSAGLGGRPFSALDAGRLVRWLPRKSKVAAECCRAGTEVGTSSEPPLPQGEYTQD